MSLLSIVITTLMFFIGGIILFLMFSFIFYKLKAKSEYQVKR